MSDSTVKRYVLGKHVHEQYDKCGTAEDISLWGVAEMCYAERLEQAEALMEQVRDSLSAHTPTIYDELIADIDAFLKERTE